MLYRSNVTELVLSTIATETSNPVGDSSSPDGSYGWSGTPGEIGSTYTPYTVVYPQTANASSGPISDPLADWKLPYSLTSYGATRAQCEWLCDIARSALLDLDRTTVTCGDATYTIQQAKVETIGSVIRSDALQPPTFGQTDIVSIWLTKGV